MMRRRSACQGVFLILFATGAVLAASGRQLEPTPRVVSLRSSNNKFVAVEKGRGGAVRADRDSVDDDARLELVAQDDGKVSIRSFGGKFFAATVDGTIRADHDDDIDDRAKFSLVASGRGKVLLRSFDGRFVTASGTDGALSGRRGTRGAARRFEVVAEDDTVATLDDALQGLRTAKASLSGLETNIANMNTEISKAEGTVADAMNMTTVARKYVMAIRREARDNRYELHKFTRATMELNSSMSMELFNMKKIQDQGGDVTNATKFLKESSDKIVTPEKVNELEQLNDQIWDVSDPSSKAYIGGLEKEQDKIETNANVFDGKLHDKIRDVLVKRLPAGVEDLRKSLHQFSRKAFLASGMKFQDEDDGPAPLGADLGLDEPQQE